MDAKSKASFDCFDLVDITHVGDLIRIELDNVTFTIGRPVFDELYRGLFDIDIAS
jgi:hypothetical protein